MYKVMIVDDEKYIRKSIKNRIDWESFGITDIREAGNGEEALSLMDEFCPEIVLVDIRMPKMDGLAFIQEAKKKHSDVNYVIMSAYSDFSYAQTAIRLGVGAYLLKPIDEEEMKKLLNTLVHRLDEDKLAGRIRKLKNVELGSDLQYPYAVSLAFYAEEQDDIGRRIETALQSQTAQSENTLVYYLRNCSRSDCYVFLINSQDNTREAGISCAEAVLETICQTELTAAVSKVFNRDEFRKAISQSICYLKRKLFYPKKKLIINSVWENNSSDERWMAVRDELSQIDRLIMRGDYERVEEGLLGIISKLIEKCSTVSQMEEGIDEILMLLKHLPEEARGDSDFNILFHDFRSKDYLLEYHTAEELKKRLNSLVSRLLNLVERQEAKDAVVSIKKYIMRNYADPLNVTELAQKYGLNVSYLSTLFKERTGINLTAYIEGTRMEKAKVLLKDKEWSVTEVAMHTGYSSSNYFSKVFKKYTGVTPKEFKETERKK